MRIAEASRLRITKRFRSERFGTLAAQVERMEQRSMAQGEQPRFAGPAWALRYPDPATQDMKAVQLPESQPLDLASVVLVS